MTPSTAPVSTGAPCVWCDAGAPLMDGVWLGAMPKGWHAAACLRFYAQGGHIEAPIPDPRKALPSGGAK